MGAEPSERPFTMAYMRSGFAEGPASARRYSVFPLRAREAIIIPLRDDAKPAAELWRTLSDTERDWFARALADLGLPMFEEIMETD